MSVAETISQQLPCVYPTTPPYREPITGSCVWQRDDFSDPADWSYHLTPATLAELARSIRRIRELGKDITTLTAADFEIPSFTADAARLREELEQGRGFVVIKGLPVEQYTDDEARMIYWGVGAFFGATIPQNIRGDRLYSVRDEGYNLATDYGAVGVRGSKSKSGLSFHVDSAPAFRGFTPDIVCLLALRTAKSGGASAIINAHTMHNLTVAEHPEYLERLYQHYHFDRRAELLPGEAPTLFAPVFTYDGLLRMRYVAFYILKGHEVAGVPLAPDDLAPIEFIESLMTREELVVHFEMARGEMQFLNNRFILHSRAGFEDHPEPERKRHLMRLWLKSLER